MYPKGSVTELQVSASNSGNRMKAGAAGVVGALPNDNEQRKIGLANAISLGTLFLTLAVSGIYPFLINPILDYAVLHELEDS